MQTVRILLCFCGLVLRLLQTIMNTCIIWTPNNCQYIYNKIKHNNCVHTNRKQFKNHVVKRRWKLKKITPNPVPASQQTRNPRLFIINWTIVKNEFKLNLNEYRNIFFQTVHIENICKLLFFFFCNSVQTHQGIMTRIYVTQI